MGLADRVYGQRHAAVDFEVDQSCLLILRPLRKRPFAEPRVSKYDEPEFDRRLGAPGLHTVSGPVRHRPRKTVLPPDLFDRFDRLTFWNDRDGSAAWRIAPDPVGDPEDDTPEGPD